MSKINGQKVQIGGPLKVSTARGLHIIARHPQSGALVECFVTLMTPDTRMFNVSLPGVIENAFRKTIERGALLPFQIVSINRLDGHVEDAPAEQTEQPAAAAATV